MNKIKNIFMLFIFAVTLLLSVDAFAVTFSTATKFTVSASDIIEPIINIVHTPITQVSPIAKEMVIKGSVDVGSSPNYLFELKLIYTLPGSSETTEDISFGSNSGVVNFSKRIAFTEESGKIEYKILATAVKGLSVSTETPKYSADILSSVSAPNISTGTIILVSGNQLYGNTKLELSDGALSDPIDITITEIGTDQTMNLSPALKAPSSQEMMLTCFEITPDMNLTGSAFLTLYYGSTTTSQNIKVKRFDGNKWVDIESGGVGSSLLKSASIKRAPSVNPSDRTVSVGITEFGRYATFAGAGSFPDSEYRPKKKVVVFGRAQIEFNNLMDGDVVKIFNINGKKIREITSGDVSGFKWDGKKDDGSYAESGAYIYQIKLAESGKLISGTVAFVR